MSNSETGVREVHRETCPTVKRVVKRLGDMPNSETGLKEAGRPLSDINHG